MSTPLFLRYHGLEPSQALSDRVREHLDTLDAKFGDLTRCNVVIDLLNQRCGKLGCYRIVVEADVPGDRLVVALGTEELGQEDAYGAVKRAFEAMRAKLERFTERRQHDTKVHAATRIHGEVCRVFPDDRFGFIKDDFGDEWFFHETELENGDFDELATGAKVKFRIDDRDPNPRAEQVRLVRRAKQQAHLGFRE